jgi:MFS family permease
VLVSIAGLGSYLQSSQIVIPETVSVAGPAATPLGARLRSLWSLVLADRPFIRFELRSLVYTASIGLALPVLPLFYVHEVAAPDAWIGVIGSAQSAGGVLGYIVARQLARRRGGAMTLLPSMLAAALAPAMLSVIGWLPAVAAISFVFGLAGASVQLALFDQFMRRLPSELAVTFSSVDQSVQNLALVVAPNVGGLLSVVIGVRATLLVVALVGAVAFALFAWNAWQAVRPASQGAPT